MAFFNWINVYSRMEWNQIEKSLDSAASTRGKPIKRTVETIYLSFVL